MENLIHKLKTAWAKVKTIKNIEIIIGIVIICLVILIYSTVTSDSGSKTSTKNDSGTNASESANELEKRLGDILSEIDGAGNVNVMVTYESDSLQVSEDEDGKEAAIKGVVIVADGADNVRVRMDLITAARTLLNVDADEIQIFDRK